VAVRGELNAICQSIRNVMHEVLSGFRMASTDQVGDDQLGVGINRGLRGAF
jgi:hypothetical protein